MVAAEDVHGNVGLPSNEASVETWTGTGETIPTRFALRGARPNPFNPVTTVVYDVPEPGGHVALEVYDVTGRSVRELVGSFQTPGKREILWGGDDDNGTALPSGVYFLKMSSGDYERTIKVTLLK
jgi:flagellar hook assembly protein FlgD